MRAWLVVVLVAGVVVGCAEPYGDSLEGGDQTPLTSSTSLVPASTMVTTTTMAPTTTASTTASDATTTTALARDPDDLTTWIGTELSVATTHPRAEGAEILANVEHFPVQFLVEDEPVEVFGWYVGGTGFAFDGPNFTVVVVDHEPNPYSPTEMEQYEEGVEPVTPDPAVTHRLTVWAIEVTGPTQYLITDTMDIELPAVFLGYGALMTVTQESWICDVDPALKPYVDPNPGGTQRDKMLFAFFDSTNYEELEIEEHYPSVLAFTHTDKQLDIVPPESVRCIIRFDPDNY